MKKTHTFFTFVTLCTGIIGFAGANTPANTPGQTTIQTTVSVPSMLDINDEYTYIVQKINAEMDVIMAECSALGLKKPEFLTGKQDSNTGRPSSGGDDNSSSGDATPGDSTNNDDEIVFQL
ncbi:MAG: hypothetical protein R8M37_02445 [Alphaproteobacteria bacterium]|nr:hypothetical protein [Alphaproteobacteria bacterium]